MIENYSITEWIAFFFIYSFLGWCIESAIVSFNKRKLTNRGFLKGPMLPLYGSGAVIMLLSTLWAKDNYVLVYICGTMAMDFWATIEHSLQYKYRHNMPEHIREKLLNAANATVALDQEMSSVRGEIMDAQNSFNYKASIVADILTNIQNLYYVGNQREVVKIQNEFYDIYQKDDLEKLEDFSKQLDIIAEGYKAQGL